MFTEVVELRAKPWKASDLCDAVSETIQPVLKKQRGFQGEITLVSDDDPNRILVLSFWNRREDAERFHREQFSQIAEMLRPLCKCEPFFGSNCSIFVLGHRFRPVLAEMLSGMRRRETLRRKDSGKGAIVGVPN
jgi:quinol monooxygenase YgiN